MTKDVISVDEVKVLVNGVRAVVSDLGVNPHTSWVTVACEALTQAQLTAPEGIKLGEVVADVFYYVSMAVALVEQARARKGKVEGYPCSE